MKESCLELNKLQRPIRKQCIGCMAFFVWQHIANLHSVKMRNLKPTSQDAGTVFMTWEGGTCKFWAVLQLSWDRAQNACDQITSGRRSIWALWKSQLELATYLPCMQNSNVWIRIAGSSGHPMLYTVHLVQIHFQSLDFSQKLLLMVSRGVCLRYH